MTVYYVDDGGTPTAPYDTWAKAAASVPDLLAAITQADGDIVYIGHDYVDAYTYTADFSTVMVSSGGTMAFISATTGSSPPTYQKATAKQIDPKKDGYGFKPQRGASWIGLSIAGDTFVPYAYTSKQYYEDCLIELGTSGQVSAVSANEMKFVRCTFDFNSSTAAAAVGIRAGLYTFEDCVFSECGSITTSIYFTNSSCPDASFIGCDFSSFATAIDLTSGANSQIPAADITFDGCKFPASWTGTPFTGTGQNNLTVEAINCGTSDHPSMYLVETEYGLVTSSTAIYRSSGGSVESESTGFNVVTTSRCKPWSPFKEIDLHGTVDAGSKTFDVYITNDDADLDTNDIWLELYYLDTLNSLPMALETTYDPVADDATTHTDDTTSTWNGTGPSFTFKQKLSITATIGEACRYVLKVVVGKQSVASGDYLYIDPLVTVS